MKSNCENTIGIEAHDDKQNSFAVNLGLCSNIVLAFLKTIAGIFGHSPALLADGINSTSDVVYYIAVKIFLRISVKPADRAHPFGHRQMESIAALVIGAFILTTAVAIFWNSINCIFDTITGRTSAEGASFYVFIISIITLAVKIVLTTITKRIGIRTGSQTVNALASDHLNDVFASLAAFIGILFSRIGLIWVDPLAGAVVALFIFKTGIEIIKESSSSLMDIAPDESVREQINAAADKIKGIIQVEDIKSHRIGKKLSLNLTIGIDGSLTVNEGDKISDKLEDLLFEKVENICDVQIHYHPVKYKLK